MRDLALLTDCLVEGDAATIARRRRSRRVSLTLSISLQVALLSFVLLAPLFAKTENLTWKNAIPIPPYRGYKANPKPQQANSTPAVQTSGRQRIRLTDFQPTHYLAAVPTVADDPRGDYSRDSAPPCNPCVPGSPDGIINLARNASDANFVPKPPVDTKPRPSAPVKVSGRVQEALLVNRVEPKYSRIAIMMRLEGTVELRAIIGKDGTIHSLELLSGHPVLGRDAMLAVQEWRYRPTLLGGEPVEVETRITVVFTLQR
jgi:protein TonB